MFKQGLTWYLVLSCCIVMAVEAAPAEKTAFVWRVVEQGSETPIAGATVIYRFFATRNQRRQMELAERMETDAEGNYAVAIPGELWNNKDLELEIEVHHVTHASHRQPAFPLRYLARPANAGARVPFEVFRLLPGEVISGRVQTPDGRPAANVLMTLCTRPAGDRDFAHRTVIKLHTDSQGEFRAMVATPITAALWIHHPEFTAEPHVVTSSGDQGVLRLQKGVSLSGTVRDVEGEPMAGVWVNAKRIKARGERQPVLEALQIGDLTRGSIQSDANGQFALPPLPPGEYRIMPGVSPTDFDMQTTRAAFSFVQMPLDDNGQPHSIELQSLPHYTIEAQATNSKGEPLPAYSLGIFGMVSESEYFSLRAGADSDGRVTICVPQGATNVGMSFANTLRHRTSPDLPFNNDVSENFRTLNGDMRSIEVIGFDSPQLTVAVVDAEGQPIEQAKVTALYPPSDTIFEGDVLDAGGEPTDVIFEALRNGSFATFYVLPEQVFTVKVSAGGYVSHEEMVKLVDGEVRELKVVLGKAIDANNN